ncbi:hypothetical protein C0J52_22397 [Blattella germanica]|nr:hypothetical protein C0J52_22397 [Blattella germanica]
MDFRFGGHCLNLQLTPRALASNHHKPFRKLLLAFSYKVRAALFSLFLYIRGFLHCQDTPMLHQMSPPIAICHMRDAVYRAFSRL